MKYSERNTEKKEIKISKRGEEKQKIESEGQHRSYCGFRRTIKGNGSELILESVMAKNCPQAIKDTHTHM